MNKGEKGRRGILNTEDQRIYILCRRLRRGRENRESLLLRGREWGEGIGRERGGTEKGMENEDRKGTGGGKRF